MVILGVNRVPLDIIEKNCKEEMSHVTLNINEDCEQLFISVGKLFTVAAILDFFHMKSFDDSPTKHK